MRTTIDLPEDLLRRARATAALRGVKLKDFVAGLIEAGLAATAAEPPRRGHRGPVPVVIPASGRKIQSLTNSEIFEILNREDDESHGRLP